MAQKKRVAILQLFGEQYPDLDRDRMTALVVCRNVLVDGELVTDPKAQVNAAAQIRLTSDKYVSRGGLKLEHALDAWHIDVASLVMLDAGSSTGGFTDCLLQRGASMVYSVDVGFNQLDWKLRTDERVRAMEQQNIMTLEALDPKPAGAVCDLSFRSIGGAASHILSLCTDNWLVSLIKPQFEVPRWQEDFFGVIEDPQLLVQVLSNVHEALAKEGVGVQAVLKSPIQGRKGNTEFLALLRMGEGLSPETFSTLVQEQLQ